MEPGKAELERIQKMNMLIEQVAPSWPMPKSWRLVTPCTRATMSVSTHRLGACTIGLEYTGWVSASNERCYCLGRIYATEGQKPELLHATPESPMWGPRARASTLIACFAAFRARQEDWVRDKSYALEVAQQWPNLISAAWGHLCAQQCDLDAPKALTLF